VTLTRTLQFGRRALFVVIGAAIALALGVTDFTVLARAVGAGVPVWIVVLIGLVIVLGPISVGLLPAVRQVEGAAAAVFLGARFGDGLPGPAVGWPQRRRTFGLVLAHVGAGLVVVAAIVGDGVLGARWWTLAAGLATLILVDVLGRGLAALAPVLLGPSYAERLAVVAARATERNRIACELHDSIGHALSLVTVQASAARKVIRSDRDFAEQALEAIETTSRRAAADLDHVLGLLRDEPRRSTTTPAPNLDSVDRLVEAAGASGLTVQLSRSGPLAAVPVLVSQEAYRIVQEGLTNALKYSTDTAARVALAADEKVLRIEVANASADHRARRPGRGLRGIAERAETLGGTARSGSHDGRWTLAVTLPIGQEQR